MPRDSNGTYSLPAGNPVVTLTTISSVWANSTLDDIATALTNSLDRAGSGGMTGQLKLANGTIGAPALSWTTEPTSGLYRNAAGDFRYSIASNDVLRLSAALVSTTTTLTQLNSNFQVSGVEAIRTYQETDAPADEKIYQWLQTAGDTFWRTRTDVDGAGVNILEVVRAGTGITSKTWPSGINVFGDNVRSDTDQTDDLGTTTMRWRRVYATEIRDSDTTVMLDSAGTVLRLGGTAQAWTEIRSGENFTPGSDNALDLGSASLRWNQVFATQLIDGTNSLISSSGTTVSIANSATWTVVNFPNGVLQYNGREVGYRNSNTNSQGGTTYTLVQDDAGRFVYATNGGAVTFTVPQLTADTLITCVNNSAGSNLTLSQGSGVTLILAGIGSTGNRTVGVRGIANLWWASATAVFVTGAGVS